MAQHMFGACCRNAQVGVPCSRACSACHTTMTIRFQTAAFVASAPSSASLGKARAHRHRQNTGAEAKSGPDPALVVGQPLPYMGTCKHYHQSHRSVTLTIACSSQSPARWFLQCQGTRRWSLLLSACIAVVSWGDQCIKCMAH